MKKEDKYKLQAELKMIKQKSDLMIYGLQNDADFPILEDFDHVDEIQKHLAEVQKMLVRNMK